MRFVAARDCTGIPARRPLRRRRASRAGPACRCGSGSPARLVGGSWLLRNERVAFRAQHAWPRCTASSRCCAGCVDSGRKVLAGAAVHPARRRVGRVRAELLMLPINHGRYGPEPAIAGRDGLSPAQRDRRRFPPPRLIAGRLSLAQLASLLHPVEHRRLRLAGAAVGPHHHVTPGDDHRQRQPLAHREVRAARYPRKSSGSRANSATKRSDAVADQEQPRHRAHRPLPLRERSTGSRTAAGLRAPSS